MKMYLNRNLLLVWLLSCTLGFVVPAVSSLADQEMPPVPGWGQVQPGNHAYDAGFKSGLDHDAELPSVTTERLNDLACTVPTIPAYDTWLLSTIRTVGVPRAPPVADVGFVAANGGNGLGNPFKGKTAAEIDEMFKPKDLNQEALIRLMARAVM